VVLIATRIVLKVGDVRVAERRGARWREGGERHHQNEATESGHGSFLGCELEMSCAES
jgi:hypothetical protein